jgi:Ca2+-transporting ATPase
VVNQPANAPPGVPVESRRPASPPWHCLAPPDALALLASASEGLSEAEAARRLERDGPNSFRSAQPVSATHILIAQLRSALVLLLIGAGAVAAATGDGSDAIAIGAVLVLNLGIGFVSELRAHRAMEALQGLEVQHAWAVRAGRARDLDARELVPGDVILLEAGQTVPADARLLESSELRTVEASLSGEPGSVPKDAAAAIDARAALADRRTMVYKSTSVVAGAARAVVVATGMGTEVGRIGELARRLAKGRTPLERRLEALGQRLGVLALVAALVIAGPGLWQGVPIGRLLQTAIALAVAAVPEGLPVVATIAMAVGVRRMARRRALIRHLPVVESLGSASVICTDKTGTLTAGRMTVTVLRLAEGEMTVAGSNPGGEAGFLLDGRPIDPSSPPQVAAALRIGALANAAELREDAAHSTGDPTDLAFLVLAQDAGIDPGRLAREWPRVRLLPFSSERMLMASLHAHDHALVTFVKGAPAAVIERCSRMATEQGARPLLPEDREQLLRWSAELAGRGLRVLALATGPVEHRDGDLLSGLTWAGFAGLSDPPAAGVAETIRAFRVAGIRTVMLTGDHRLTAAALARELGLLREGDEVLEGRDLDRLTDPELDALLPRIGAVGRMTPEAKVRVIAAFQRQGAVVAMLGDGVNDAAALRQADVGVAMGGRGTDLAKEAADVVLEDDRFSTIGAAIEEGRVILANIRKFVAYLVSGNLAEMLVLFAAGLGGYPAALAPLQILWLNLLTDTAPALALAGEPGEAGVMRAPPSDPCSPILGGAELRSAVVYALLIAACSLAAFVWGLRAEGPAAATTMAFMTLGLAQVFHLGNARSTGPVLSVPRVLGNRPAIAAAAGASGLQILTAVVPPLSDLLHVAPLSARGWLVTGALGVLPAVLGQTFKTVRQGSAA